MGDELREIICTCNLQVVNSAPDLDGTWDSQPTAEPRHGEMNKTRGWHARTHGALAF
jgi:hypothetical protein